MNAVIKKGVSYRHLFLYIYIMNEIETIKSHIQANQHKLELLNNSLELRLKDADINDVINSPKLMDEIKLIASEISKVKESSDKIVNILLDVMIKNSGILKDD